MSNVVQLHPAASTTPLAPPPESDRRRVNVGPPRYVGERRRTTSGRTATDALKMSCPHCGCSESAVVRSRGGIEVDQVRRRRECVECGKRFSTHERVDYAQLAREAVGDLPSSATEAERQATWEEVFGLLHGLRRLANDACVANPAVDAQIQAITSSLADLEQAA
jgi:transcriptional regulator NrdR family protein